MTEPARWCARCSALVPLRKTQPCASCVAAGAKLAQPPWLLGHTRDRRECVVCCAALALPAAADEPVRVCAGHRAALERALGLTGGDAEFSQAPKTAPRSNLIHSLWVR